MYILRFFCPSPELCTPVRFFLFQGIWGGRGEYPQAKAWENLQDKMPYTKTHALPAISSHLQPQRIPVQPFHKDAVL